jgi:UrcA family protein
MELHMSISTVLTRRLIWKTTLSAVGLTALGVAATAQQLSPPSHAADTQTSLSARDTRVADVSLADLDLSGPEGMRVARERLHTMAQRICAGPDNPRLSSQPGFVACVDSTVASALRHISTLQTPATVRNSVTRAGNVSVADLDLSTPEGSRVARERLEAMARRLCAELARSNDLSYRPNWAACVHDTTTDALAQANVLAAAKETRTAQRSAP